MTWRPSTFEWSPLPNQRTWVGLATRYGSNAMESLINDVLKIGGQRERLEIKIFGGGRVLAHMTDIGARNIEFVRNYLSTEGLRTNAQDVGGEQPRKVIYYPTEGRVRVRKLRPIEVRGRTLLARCRHRGCVLGGEYRSDGLRPGARSLRQRLADLDLQRSNAAGEVCP